MAHRGAGLSADSESGDAAAVAGGGPVGGIEFEEAVEAAVGAFHPPAGVGGAVRVVQGHGVPGADLLLVRRQLRMSTDDN